MPFYTGDTVVVMNVMLKKILAVITSVLMIFVYAENAGASAFNFSGTVTNVSDNSADTSITIGSEFSGIVIFDETTPSYNEGKYQPSYSIQNQITVNIEGLNLIKILNNITIFDDKETCVTEDCSYLDRFFVNAGDNFGPNYDFIQFWIDEYTVGLPKPTMITSFSLPLYPLDLNLATTATFVISIDGLSIGGEIKSLTSTIDLDAVYQDGYDAGLLQCTPSDDTIIVCHKGMTKTISASKLDTHLNHGDYEGACN